MMFSSWSYIVDMYMYVCTAYNIRSQAKFIPKICNFSFEETFVDSKVSKFKNVSKALANFAVILVVVVCVVLIVVIIVVNTNVFRF